MTLLRDRDCGDEADTLHVRNAVVSVMPICPKCLRALERPDGVRDTKFYVVTCRGCGGCGQTVAARFYSEQ